jgi:hypothetical protein
VAKKRGLILIREDEVPRLKLVHLEIPIGALYKDGSILWGVLLLAKLAGSAFGGVNSGGTHFDAKLV